MSTELMGAKQTVEHQDKLMREYEFEFGVTAGKRFEPFDVVSEVAYVLRNEYGMELDRLLPSTVGEGGATVRMVYRRELC